MWGSQMVIFLLMLKAGFEIQFKLGQPSKHVNDLKKKILKTIPMKTLWYLIVSSAVIKPSFDAMVIR